MPFDYDLVIIGNSLAGILTAIKAAQLKARVALVQTDSQPNSALWSCIFNRVFHYCSDSPLIIQKNQFSPFSYTSEVINCLNDGYSPALLSSQGIDVIEGNGEFCRLPKPAFIVNHRKLHSRSYLLALESSPLLPNIQGLEETGCLTLLEILTYNNFEKLPFNLTIIGGHYITLELAQILSQLGKSVNLVIENNHCIKNFDSEAFSIIHTILKISGVNLIFGDNVTQVRKIEDKKWLQVGNRAIETDEIIVISSFSPNLTGLNLEAMGINEKKIELNSKLQTSHSSIYSFTNDNNLEEIEIIIKNSLFFPIYKLTKPLKTQVVYTKPVIAQVGYTEIEAKKYFKQPILVGKVYFKDVLKSQIHDHNTGFIKLIASSNMVLVGATIIGEEAEELVGLLTLAIQKKTRLNSLSKITFPILSYSNIIYHAALDALEKADKKHGDSLLKSWFIWRKL